MTRSRVRSKSLRRGSASARGTIRAAATTPEDAERLIERTELIRRARLLDVSLRDNDASRLLRLLDELERWNAAYNLTSVRGREEMITHHLLDSLSLHAHLRGSRIADVGTGAGFPGLPLAVANPERQFTLIDSAGKKIRFVAHAARVLGLGNVVAVHARAEALRADPPFDTVTARAVAALPDLLASVRPLCGAGTRVLGMKGQHPDEEIADVLPPWYVADVRPLEVPGLEEARHLVIVECDGNPSMS